MLELYAFAFQPILDRPILALTASTIFYWFTLSYFLGETRKLKNVPTTFSNIPIISFLQIWRYFFQVKQVVDDSFQKWPKTMFRIPEALRWTVVASDRKLVEEILRLPDNAFSAMLGSEELVQMKYTIGHGTLRNPYHIPLLSNQLRRTLPYFVPQVYDELTFAFTKRIPLTEDWSPVKCHHVVPRIVSQASNRIFVGLPLCRDPEFTELSTQFTFDVFTVAFVLRWIPDFMKPLVNTLISNVPKQKRKALKFLGPLIDSRREQSEKGIEKPVDMLTWLMDAAKPEDSSNEALTDRILTINFGAIHTSSLSFMHALYHLASSPDYAQLLREEIDTVVEEHGWTKTGMDHMKRVDSFMRESQRITPLGNVGLGRVALRDHQFSDGTFVPKGTMVCVNIHGPHFDESIYKDAHTFDPLRFVETEENSARTMDMTSTSSDYLAFGHGRHACPGRFFAASELKMMLAYVAKNYDVKFGNDGRRPDDLWVLNSCLPNPKAEVFFRKRRV